MFPRRAVMHREHGARCFASPRGYHGGDGRRGGEVAKAGRRCEAEDGDKTHLVRQPLELRRLRKAGRGSHTLRDGVQRTS